MNPENFTEEELKTIYEEDNMNTDCDCECCRYFRQLLKEKE